MLTQSGKATCPEHSGFFCQPSLFRLQHRSSRRILPYLCAVMVWEARTMSPVLLATETPWSSLALQHVPFFFLVMAYVFFRIE